MSNDIEILRKEIYGNGGTGLKERIGKLEMCETENKKTFEEIRSALEANATIVSGLIKYQTQDETRKEIEEKRLKERRQDKRFMIVQTISIISIAITIIIYILSSHG